MVIKDEDTRARTVPAAGRTGLPAAGRWVWLVTFAAVAGLLLIRSAFLFTTRLHETADEAANSVLVMQAQHFTLLHGNYSRTGFFHPGPAYMYVMAAGQWLFHDVSHLVPTPWNGQLIAILLLNSAMVATVAWIVYGWARSAWAAAAAVSVIILLAAAVDIGVPAVANRDILAANWMPDMYVLVFMAFVVAAASVAAGRTGHLWLLAATGWLVIHGHAEFLFFVPLIVVAAAAAALWPARRAPWAAVRRFARHRWRHYVPALLVSALFALPIVADVVLHWPGQLGKYWNYARSARAGHHPLSEVVRYLLWYWAPGPLWVGLLVMAVAVTAAVTVAMKAAPVTDAGPAVTAAAPAVTGAAPAVTRAAPAVTGAAPAVTGAAPDDAEAGNPVTDAAAAAGGLRRFLFAALWICAVSTAGMLYYGGRGIDTLTAKYVGFFYWSVPLLTLLVISTGLTAALRGRRIGRLAVTTAAAAALAVGAVSPALRADVHDNEPALVPAMAALAARAHGRLIVLRTDGALFDTHGLVVQAERTGVRVCVAGTNRLLFSFTTQFLCGPRQEAAGYAVRLYPRPYHPVPGQQVIASLRYSVVTVPGTPARGGQA